MCYSSFGRFGIVSVHYVFLFIVLIFLFVVNSQQEFGNQAYFFVCVDDCALCEYSNLQRLMKAKAKGINNNKKPTDVKSNTAQNQCTNIFLLMLMLMLFFAFFGKQQRREYCSFASSWMWSILNFSISLFCKEKGEKCIPLIVLFIS